MPEDVSWADEAIKKAHKSHAAVNESVTVRLKEILVGRQSERVLRGSELANAAKALITDMAISTPKAVKNHED